MTDTDLRVIIDATISPAFRRTLAEIEKEFKKIESSLAKGGLNDQNAVRAAEAYLGKLREMRTVQRAIAVENERDRMERKTGDQLQVSQVDNILRKEQEVLSAKREQLKVGREQAALTRQYATSVDRMLGLGGGLSAGSLGTSGSRSIVEGIASRAGLASTAIQRIDTDAQSAAKSVHGIGEAGKFSVRVLEAFFLYRGFVFLQQGAMDTTRALIDLEHQLNLVKTQLPNFGAGQGGLITRGVMQVSRETGVAFNDTAKALYNISSAGYSGAEAIRVLELSMKAAVAGGLQDADVAFNSALASMNAFGISSSRLEEVLDKQFAAVRRGIFTYQQFGMQVGVLSEAFAQAGQSIETTYAAMATVSEVFTGPQFNRGATGLRNLAEALTNQREEFEKYGISVVDAKGNIRNLIDVVQDLKNLTESMTTSERAQVITDIFPDVREQAGVVALINNLDSLKRNYVEQKFALGDLENAYDVFEDDTKKQGTILANNVKSGFQPLANTVGVVVKGFNLMDDVLPGITSGVIGMTGAVTALALSMAFLNKEVVVNGVAMSRMAAMRAGFTSPIGVGPISSRITPAMAGFSIFGGAVGGSLGDRIASAQAQRSVGGFFGALGAGAAAGSAGFLAGPQVGAVSTAIGAISGAFSYMMHDFESKIPQMGNSFAEVFAATLSKNMGDVAGAFSTALGLVNRNSGMPDLGAMSYQIANAEDFTTFGANYRAARDRLGIGPLGGAIVGTLGWGGAGVRSLFGDSGLTQYSFQQGPGAVDLATRLRSQLGVYDTTGANAIRSKALSPAEVQAGRDALVQSFLEVELSTKGLNDEQLRAQNTLRSLVPILANSSVATQDFASILEKSGGDAMKFFDLLAEAAGELAPAIDAASQEFAKQAAQIRSMTTGDFGLAADVFSKMGEEGERLAEVFRRISQVGNAVATLESLRQAGFNETVTTPAYSSREAAQAAAMEQLGISSIRTLPQGLAVQKLTNELMAQTKTTTQFISILEKLGIDSNEAMRLLSEQLISNLGLVEGNFTPEELVKALLGGGDVASAAQPQLGSTSLADALNEAAEAVRQGLVDPMGYTAEQLMEMADGLYAFNRVMAKVNILEELKRIADLTGNPFPSLGSAFEIFSRELQAAGVDLQEVFSDPQKLAEFLSNVQFSDINVDNSQDFNITFRITGGTNLETLKASELADSLQVELADRMRRRLG